MAIVPSGSAAAGAAAPREPRRRLVDPAAQEGLDTADAPIQREDSLRPRRLADYIGQSELKQVLDEPMREMRQTADAIRQAADFDAAADLLEGKPRSAASSSAAAASGSVGPETAAAPETPPETAAAPETPTPPGTTTAADGAPVEPPPASTGTTAS